MSKKKKMLPVAGVKPDVVHHWDMGNLHQTPTEEEQKPHWRDRVREIVTPIWFDYRGTHFFDGDGKMIAQIRGWGGLTSSGLTDEEARAIQEKNAGYIVNAVNEHETLTAKIEQMQEILKSANIEILEDGSHQFKPKAVKHYCGEITARRIEALEAKLATAEKLDKYMDDGQPEAVNAFVLAMKNKLYQKSLEGYEGWDEPSAKQFIEDSFYKHVERQKASGGQLVDVANLAMMLWNFEQKENTDA